MLQQGWATPAGCKDATLHTRTEIEVSHDLPCELPCSGLGSLPNNLFDKDPWQYWHTENHDQLDGKKSADSTKPIYYAKVKSVGQVTRRGLHEPRLRRRKPITSVTSEIYIRVKHF